MGYDLTAEQSAQYQLSLRASAPGREAVIIHHFNAGGVLGAERKASATGDITVLGELRSAVRASTP
jgi:hypothetical protein